MFKKDFLRQKILAIGCLYIVFSLALNNGFSQKATAYKIDSLLNISEKEFVNNAKNNEYYSKKALDLSFKIDDKERVIKSYISLGKIQQFSNPSMALVNFEKAVELSEKLNNYHLSLKSYRVLAIYYLKWKQYDDAYKYIQKEIKVINDNKLGLTPPYSLIANIYKEQGNYDQAISYFKKSIKYENIKDLASLNSDIGNVYYSIQNYDRAIRYYKKGIIEAKKTKSFRHLGFLTDNIGLALCQKGKFKEAKKWQKESLKYREKVGSEFGLMVILNNLGKTHLKLNELDSALILAKRSYDLSKNFSELFLKKEVTELLADIYAQKKDYQKAYNFFGKSMKWQEKMTLEKNNISLRNVVSSFEIKQAKLKLDLLEAKNNLYLWIGIAMLLVIISIGVLLFMLNRQNRHRKILLKKEEKLNLTKDKLFSVISHDLRAPISSLQSLLLLNEIQKQPQEKMEQRMDKIGRQINNINLLLKNLLLWSNNQLNGLKTQPVTLNLSEAAQTQIDALEGVAQQKNISIINTINKESKAFCDKDQYELIIRNLISNALKYTNKGGEIVIEEKKGENSITILVKDNGIGMDKVTIQELVENKAQSTSKTGTNGEVGTGIGISLVKEMIKYNKGDFWIESELGKGSIFSFSLPLN